VKLNAAEMYTFRTATIDDFNAIQGLLMQHQLTVDGLAQHIQHFEVVMDTNQLIGVAGVEQYFPFALIRSVAIDSQYQHQQIGKQLIETLLSKLNAEGYTTYYLLTETATTFFSKLNFHTIPRSEVPDVIQQTKEFATICPDSATVMTKNNLSL
jgi:amino-acid N-acetyltransferase